MVGGIHLLRQSGIVYEDSLTDLGLNVSTDYIEFEVTKEGSTAFGHVTFPGGASSGNINGPGLPPLLVGSGSIALNNGISLQQPQDQVIMFNEDGTLGVSNGIVDTVLTIADSTPGPGGSGQVFAGYAFIGATGDIAGFSVAGTRSARSLYSIGRSLEDRGLIFINGLTLAQSQGSKDAIQVAAGSGLFGFRSLNFTASPSGTDMTDEFGNVFNFLSTGNFDDGAGNSVPMTDNFFKMDQVYLKNDGSLGYARARGEYKKLYDCLHNVDGIDGQVPEALQRIALPLAKICVQKNGGIIQIVNLLRIAPATSKSTPIFEDSEINSTQNYIDFEVTLEGTTAIANVKFEGTEAGKPSGTAYYEIGGRKDIPSGTIELVNGTSFLNSKFNIIFWDNDQVLRNTDDVIGFITSVSTSGAVPAGIARIGVDGDVVLAAPNSFRVFNNMNDQFIRNVRDGMVYVDGGKLTGDVAGSGFDVTSITFTEGTRQTANSGIETANGDPLRDVFGNTYVGVDTTHYDDGSGGEVNVQNNRFKMDIIYVTSDGQWRIGRATQPASEYASAIEAEVDLEETAGKIDINIAAFSLPVAYVISRRQGGTGTIVATKSLRGHHAKEFTDAA